MPIKDRSRTAANLIAALAATLLLLSLICLPPRLLELPGNATRENVLAHQPLLKTDLTNFVNTRQAALAWRTNADSMNDLARASFVLAENKEFEKPVSLTDIDQSIIWQKRALARAPFDPFGWQQLAYLTYQKDGPTDEAANQLKLSIKTGPYEPQMMLSRLDLMVKLESRLDEQTKKDLPFYVREAWAISPEGVARAAKKGSYLSLVDQALAENTEQRRKFQNLVENAPPEK